tara:strand:+ start:2505 stop:2927 length:423 start_codon:yes stop_codon:yes gene_type:complete
MARVTVEDCIEKIPNRFDLVLAAAQRSRNITSGNPITLDRDNDKNPVVALREIAEDTIDPNILRDELIKGLQKLTYQDPSTNEEESEDEANEEDIQETRNMISQELKEISSSQESELDLKSNLNSGFQDVDDALIKSEEL